MQTHYDSDFNPSENFMRRLTERANAARGKSTITSGKSDEQSLAVWDAHGVHVTHRPPDEQGVLRISIGGGDDLPVPLNYLVFRGEHGKCIALLEKALAALKRGPE